MENEAGVRVVNKYERYSGVCDVISPQEARAMADELREYRRDQDRKIMIGVMAGPFSLRPEVGGADGDEERSVFPTREQLALGFTDDPDVLNTIHYADLYRDKEVVNRDLPESLELVVKYGGENLHAIQLDVTWPDVEVLDQFKAVHPDIKIVLQVGTFALKETKNNPNDPEEAVDPQKVVEWLDRYGTSIDYVLLDMSMGKGIGMEAGGLLPMLRTINKELPGLGLAVAGGLGPDSVDALEPIAKEFPFVSFDAQGRVKPLNAPKDAYGHMVSTVPADPERSKGYIRKSCSIVDIDGTLT